MHRSHSARVSISLHLDGQTLRVAQLGPDFLILRDRIQLSPCEGEIELTIDGEVKRWHVRLPQGSDGINAVRTAIIPASTASTTDPMK